MSDISQIEWNIIHARVCATRHSLGLKTLSVSYLWMVLEQFFPGNAEDRLTSITDGGEDQGVDAIHIIENTTNAVIYIFQSKYRETRESTGKTINDAEALRISAFIENLFNRDERLIRNGNFLLTELVKQIWVLDDKGIICSYKIVFCSNDKGLSPSAEGIIKILTKKHDQVTAEQYRHTDFIKDLSSEHGVKASGELQIIGKDIFMRADGNIRGAVASIDAQSFIELIRIGDSHSIKKYLFNDNLRVFLGANGGYNQAIINTAVSNESHIFWYLNNGITITCRNFSYNKGHMSPTLKLEDFQIVNGAQTSHSLMEASRINPQALENVVLLVKIFATDEPEIVEKVAVATNSQARIQGRDLRSNSSILKKLEIAFKDRGYYFERKRNMHSDQDVARRIDVLKMGQIIMAYLLGDPANARGASDTIFDNRFSEVFHEMLDIDALIRMFEIYSRIEFLRDDYSKNSTILSHKDSDQKYLSYGHWHVLYAAKLLLENQSDKKKIYLKNIPKLVDDAISIVARACENQGTISHYQLFRSAKTKAQIFSELHGRQADLFDFVQS